MSQKLKLRSRNSSLKLLTSKQNKSNFHPDQLNRNTRKSILQSPTHTQQNDLNFLITTKISLSNQNKQKINYNRLSASQLSFHTTKQQAKSRIQKLKLEVKYLQQNDFSGPYQTQLGSFSKDKNTHTLTQKSRYIRTNQFISTRKKNQNCDKIRQSLNSRRKKTTSTIINIHKFQQFDTIQHPQSLSFQMKPLQTIDQPLIKHKKRETPSIIKKYYKVDSFRKELNKLKSNRYDAYLCCSQQLKNNKFQEEIEGINVTQIYRKNKKYQDYNIICL